MVSNYLGEAGFQTAIARTGASGIALHDREPFDVLILDLMLPDMDGLDVCRRIREKSRDADPDADRARRCRWTAWSGSKWAPTIISPKPFEPRELLARLRRAAAPLKVGAQTDILRFGRLEIDTGARQVRLDGEERSVTSYQFALLLSLAQNAGRVLSRDALMNLAQERAAGSVRPLDRRACLAHPRRDRGRSEKAASASSRCAARVMCSPRCRTERHAAPVPENLPDHRGRAAAGGAGGGRDLALRSSRRRRSQKAFEVAGELRQRPCRPRRAGAAQQAAIASSRSGLHINSRCSIRTCG